MTPPCTYILPLVKGTPESLLMPIAIFLGTSKFNNEFKASKTIIPPTTAACAIYLLVPFPCGDELSQNCFKSGQTGKNYDDIYVIKKQTVVVLLEAFFFSHHTRQPEKKKKREIPAGPKKKRTTVL
jgi:hypothetical protein